MGKKTGRLDLQLLAERIKEHIGVLHASEQKKPLLASWPKHYHWVIYNKANGTIKIGLWINGELLAVNGKPGKRMHNDYRIKY